MNTYTSPPESELSAALAKEIGWKSAFHFFEGCDDAKRTTDGMVFCPITDRNHSYLAVERCAELKLWNEYSANLHDEVHGNDEQYEGRCTTHMLFPTPTQQSYAAHKTLFENRTTNESPLRPTSRSR